MPHQPLVSLAAQNNAEWCDAFCRTHGVVGRFRANCWSSPVRTPPYYPDAVTLVPEISVEQVLSCIDTSEGWSALTTDEQLAEWEAAWGELPEGSGFFRRALLEDGRIGVLAGYDGGRIVAGAIANRSSTVIGLSNVFDVAGDLESAWVAGAAVAAARWGEMPTVGYDSGDSLDAAHRAGFESIGELVVWLNAPSSPECAVQSNDVSSEDRADPPTANPQPPRPGVRLRP